MKINYNVLVYITHYFGLATVVFVPTFLFNSTLKITKGFPLSWVLKTRETK